MAPPPLPDELKRVGIPVMGGLSLACSMSQGPEPVDERDVLGSWNLVEINYLDAYSEHPSASTYEHQGEPCTYFEARDLEIDSATHARSVRISGHLGCYGDEVERVTTEMVVEIGNDGVLELTYADEADDPLSDTGGLSRTVFTCERRRDVLNCTPEVSSLVYARPECGDTSECPASESCIARQCVPIASNALVSGELSAWRTGLGGETGP